VRDPVKPERSYKLAPVSLPVIVGGELGSHDLVTDLEDAPYAIADR